MLCIGYGAPDEGSLSANEKRVCGAITLTRIASVDAMPPSPTREEANRLVAIAIYKSSLD